jgi:sarcosine oxidase subunit delta
MLSIPCPFCGERDELEFSYGGEAGVSYPADPSALSDEQWGRWLFVHANPKGRFAERWVHTHGCRRWFVLVRDTVTHELVR